MRRLGRRLITPNDSETSLEKRGFHVKSPAAQEVLETIGRKFLTGYGEAVEAGSAAALPARLVDVPVRYRGFAYEGAAMGFTMVDALTFSRGRRIQQFIAGPGEPHIYMAYVGIGWAMARLPRFRWPAFTLDPLLRWLVLDGYGFHQAYFKTEQYVRRQYQAEHFPWPADDRFRYAGNALDQGIGRALWFVGGTDPDLVASIIEGFPASRRADLYSGAGLAAAYAGGADEAELRGFWKRAGEHRPLLAQGAAFGAEARLKAGLVVPHVELATHVFLDMTPAEASRICAESIPADAGEPMGAPGSTRVPYEAWRQRVADELVSLGRC